MTGWIRRSLVVLGSLVAFSAAVTGPAHAEPAPPATLQHGVFIGCGFVDVVMRTSSPDTHLFEFFDNGKRVWSKSLMGDNQTHEPAKEGHTYRLNHEGNLDGQVVYHRPAACDTTHLTATVSAEPTCAQSQQRRVHVRNDGATAVQVSTSGIWQQFTDFVEIAAGAEHDFVGTWSDYLVIGTPDAPLPYAVLPPIPPTGCGVFTSRLTALCGNQVRWDVGSEAIADQSLAIFREFGPIPQTPTPAWLGTLPANGKLTVYAPVVKGDTVLATEGGLRDGTQDPYVAQVLSQIEGYDEPAVCARPEQAAVTYKATCTTITATITNYGAEREFTVTAGDETVNTVTLTRGDVATVEIPLAAGATAAVAVSGQDAFASYQQHTCPSATPSAGSTGNGGGGGSDGGGLPITGAPVAWFALGGATLLLAGAALMLAARRRRL
ncbi:LPXTG cell wall anchor domain-containing protein [Actinoplanes sp. NPDC026619]|uniref:LPXTG cell wall anchor domain-containing protein n=1 Tax=Actinoplanes sp. NPDC026619 TaxID=3155798 RepID=UPI0033C71AA5